MGSEDDVWTRDDGRKKDSGSCRRRKQEKLRTEITIAEKATRGKQKKGRNDS